jgi:hypothetical protein
MFSTYSIDGGCCLPVFLLFVFMSFSEWKSIAPPDRIKNSKNLCFCWQYCANHCRQKLSLPPLLNLLYGTGNFDKIWCA